MEPVFAPVQKVLSWSEGLDVHCEFFLSFVVLHQDLAAENDEAVSGSLFVELQLLSGRCNRVLHRVHSLLGLDIGGLRVLVVQKA